MRTKTQEANQMKPKHSAIIAIRTKGIVDLEFARPLDVAATSQIKSLELHEGVKIHDIPQALGKSGFWIMHSDVWDGATIAKECLNLLKQKGFEESQILLTGFTL